MKPPDLLPRPSPSDLGTRLGPWLLLPVLLAYGALGIPLQLLHRGAGVWLSSALVFAGLPTMILQRLGTSPARESGLLPFRPRDFAWGFGLGAANWPAWAVPLMTLAQAFAPREWVELFDGAATFRGLRPWELGLMAAGVSVAAPVCEEFFFRGVVQRGLVALLGGWRGVLAAALIFGVMHFDPVGLVPRVELGLLFGVLAWRRANLWAAIGAHAANNLVATVAFLWAGDVEPPSWALGAMVIAGNVVLGAGLWRFVRPLALPPEPPPPRTPPSWPRVAAPWAALLAVGIGAVWLFDGTAVTLAQVDRRTPLGKAARGTPAEEEVRALRARVLAGEASVEEYEAARRALK